MLKAALLHPEGGTLARLKWLFRATRVALLYVMIASPCCLTAVYAIVRALSMPRVMPLAVYDSVVRECS